MPCVSIPHGALCEMRPLNTELMVLNKLDLPAPTGPSIRIRISESPNLPDGLNDTMSSVSFSRNFNPDRLHLQEQ
ncbi:hypothetical protein DPMN_049113 [Dreissena polymorpha]|uniref:Uncharacterized protein n=1 Tax=Dreissena polymorpha TaxID=45954 RepID=A0A9D4I3J1_DREPO|nr:hypothetical protein DPMN_049113 [Dreissena polymorpha]